MKRLRTQSFLCISVVALLLGSTPPVLTATKPPVQDFTQGGQKDQKHDWNLGPTGARGWIWGWKLETTDARKSFGRAITRAETPEARPFLNAMHTSSG